MEYLLGIAALLLAGFGVYQNGKKNNAVLKAEELEMKNKIADLNNKIAANNSSLESEAAKRAELESNAQKEENKDVSQEDIIKFLNSSDKQ